MGTASKMSLMHNATLNNDKDLALLSSRGSHSVFPDLRGGTQSAASFELGIERRNPLTREFSPASLGIDYWERVV